MRQIMPMQSIGVLAESELSPSARLVAVMLMHHVNRKNGLCYPSVSTLASDCGCQPTTIKKALAELKDLGFINWETKQLPRVSTRVNHYSLLFAHWSDSDQSNDQWNDQSNDQWNDQSPDRSPDRSPDQSPDRSISGHNPIEPKEPIEPKNTPLTPQGGDSARSRSTRFVPPSSDEVQRYCDERHNGIVGSEFCDFYASKGWMIGKTRMKDWKAAIRTWERKRQEIRAAAQDKFAGAI